MDTSWFSNTHLENHQLCYPAWVGYNVCVCIDIIVCVCFLFLINMYEDFNNLPRWLEFLPPLVHSVLSHNCPKALTMARTICMNAERSLQGQKKEKFPSHRYTIEGRKISSLSFLWDLQEAAAEWRWWCVQQARASLRENRMKSSQQRRSSSWWLDSDFLEAFFIKQIVVYANQKKKNLLKSWTKKRNQSEWVAPGQQNFWIDCGILIMMCRTRIEPGLVRRLY